MTWLPPDFAMGSGEERNSPLPHYFGECDEQNRFASRDLVAINGYRRNLSGHSSDAQVRDGRIGHRIGLSSR